MKNPFKKPNPYQQYKEYCKTKRVKQVGKRHHANEIFLALTSWQKEISLNNLSNK